MNRTKPICSERSSRQCHVVPSALRALTRYGVCVGIVTVIMLCLIYGWFGSWTGFCAFLEGKSIVPDEPSVHLGNIAAEQTSNVHFRLWNYSGRHATVIGAKTDCGCFLTNDLPMPIPPGTSASIVFRIRPRQEHVNTDVQYKAILLCDVGSSPIVLTACAHVISMDSSSREQHDGPE